MSTPTEEPTVRDLAAEIINAVAVHGDDHIGIISAIKGPIAALAKRDDLLELGIPRQGNNVASSQYLYFDGQLSILIFEVPKGETIPPHDHGVWEGFCVYRGQVHHKVYRRADDGSVDDYAELELLEGATLKAGEVTIVAPPADIHSFTALMEGTIGLTFLNGVYNNNRNIYQPETNSYIAKRPLNLR